jgi:choline dehydrogenase-like flavoprotein
MSDIADFVVIGGGSAGCTIASRLSEDPAVSVALIEAGGNDDGWMVRTPAALFMMVASPINNWHFSTVPQPGLDGRRGYQPRGKGLGGSSSINAMVYIRGHRRDYDHWAELGNKGWSYDEVLPYFRRAENNHGIRDEYHGNEGPLHVSDLRSDNPIQQVYLQAAREAGFPIIRDFNGADQEGVGLYQVTQKDGERWSAARGYIHPFMNNRANLRVETHAIATRILFENRRAVGVQYHQGGETKTLRAAREVILSSGAFQTPQLLLLSGVGDAESLRSLGIEPLHHLPGVGKNLHDQPDFVFGYSSDNEHTFGLSLDAPAQLVEAIAQYRRERRGQLASSWAEGGAFLKTHPDLAQPNIQLHFGAALVDDHGRQLHWGRGYSCHFALLQPKSRGSVWLESPDPFGAPAIDPNFLGERADLDEMVDGFKLTRRFMDMPALLALRKKDVFTEHVHTDDDIRAVLRARADTVYHPVGSCRMGVNDPLAVVDGELKVHGLDGLRIVDASVMPRIVSGNTNAPTIMIAEKAADLIRADMRRRSEAA